MTNNNPRNLAFAAFIASLPHKEKVACYRDIRETVEVSQDTITHWRLGRSPMRRVYYDKIMEITGVNLDDYLPK